MAELILNVSLVNPEKPKEKIQKNNSEKNDISFKDTLNKFKEESKTEKIMEKLENKIENIEKKLSAIENTELPKEEIINFINNIKELLNQLKQSMNNNNNEKKELNTNILFAIDSILQMIENFLMKGDFKNLMELIKNNKTEINLEKIFTKENISTENKEPLHQKESIKNDNNINFTETKQIEKINPENKQIVKNVEPKNEETKNIIIEKVKKETETIKEMIITIDKKVDKQENIIVKNYSPFTSSLNKANIEALINQITGRALVVIKDGKSELKMQLFPPELGKMNMKFVLEDGQLTGKIVVSTKEAFMLFDHNKEQLAQSLNQAGVDVGRIDISLSDFETNGEGHSQEEKMEKSFFFGDITKSENFEDDFVKTNFLLDSTINYLV
ncbi:MAG: flagellar hook-length control protein FliK [Brevinematales bacterium]|nr:flagellar hook-length control protein FliK [Brevinematales bacterium]